jgi:hypothetical protein
MQRRLPASRSFERREEDDFIYQRLRDEASVRTGEVVRIAPTSFASLTEGGALDDVIGVQAWPPWGPVATLPGWPASPLRRAEGGEKKKASWT